MINASRADALLQLQLAASEMPYLRYGSCTDVIGAFGMSQRHRPVDFHKAELGA